VPKRDLWLWDDFTGSWVKALGTAAGQLEVYIAANAAPGANLYGWDGAAWDKVSINADGEVMTQPGHHELTQTRETAVGSVIEDHVHLHWLTINPSGNNNVLELTDDADGSTAVVWDWSHATRYSIHITFEPSFHFATGIYIKTFTALTSVIMGYD